MKTIIRIPVYFIATACICILLLTMVSCIPRTMIQTQSGNSAEYFSNREPFALLFGDYINTMQDNYSDTVLCDIAYCIDTSRPFSSVVCAKYAQGKYEEAYEGYLAAVQGKKVPEQEYGRYWHGSLVLIRPLLMLVPIGTIRMLCGLASLLIQLTIGAVLIKRGRKEFACCYLLAFLLIQPWMLFTSLEYGTAFLAASAASLAAISKKNKADASYMPFFVVVGTVTCFVDFLTTETLTFTLPMLLILTERIDSEEYDVRSGCLLVLYNGLCWLGGYLGMFVLKIGILTMTAGSEVARSSMKEGFLRLGGEVRNANISTAPVVDVGHQFGGAIWHNLACLLPTHSGEMRAMSVWILTGIVLFIAMVAVYLIHEKIDWRFFAPAGMLAMLPYLRFLVLSNHSYEHFFITYRAQMVTLAVFIYFIYENAIKQIVTKR